MRHNKALQQAETDTAQITTLSNKVVTTETKLTEQVLVNEQLMTNLAQKAVEAQQLSNTLATARTTLTRVMEEAKVAATNAAAEAAKKDARIAELETQRDDLTKRMTDLNGQITSLEGNIADTQRKLAASEGDREFLLKELRRMQTEKTELEKQFNDLAMLREQVRKLRDELSVSRRLDWIRRGLYGSLKGAERLQQGPVQVPNTRTNFDLNVEIKQSGEVKVAPPSTNAPAPRTNAPAPANTGAQGNPAAAPAPVAPK
jgi:chromosome segregation ATPase